VRTREHASQALAFRQQGLALHDLEHCHRVGFARVVEVDLHHEPLGVFVGALRNVGQRRVTGAQHVDGSEQVHGVLLALHAPENVLAARKDRGRRKGDGKCQQECREVSHQRMYPWSHSRAVRNEGA